MKPRTACASFSHRFWPCKDLGENVGMCALQIQGPSLAPFSPHSSAGCGPRIDHSGSYCTMGTTSAPRQLQGKRAGSQPGWATGIPASPHLPPTHRHTGPHFWKLTREGSPTGLGTKFSWVHNCKILRAEALRGSRGSRGSRTNTDRWTGTEAHTDNPE